jgi:4-amino-4-deoxy-L-arabinose transferase-like glycosyltransferase
MDESLKDGWGRTDEEWPRDVASRALRALQRTLATHWGEATCAFLLLVMSLNLLGATSRKSITVDETLLIPAAYYHLAAGDFHLVYEHPPLCKILAAVPLLFIQPKELSPGAIDPAAEVPTRVGAQQGYFWEDNLSSFESIGFWARVPMIALTIALGIVIFAFARDLFGTTAALIAVLLFMLEPTVLAHGRVVQTDIPAAFGFVLACFTLHRYLQKRTPTNAAWLGVASGVALLSKFSMLIIAPILAVVFAILVWRARKTGERRTRLLMHVFIVALVPLLIVNAAYYFHSRELVDYDFRWIAASFPDRTQMVTTAVRGLSYLLPTDFVMGIFWQLWHSGEGHPAGLLGMYSLKGWWYYFPVAFALKTSLPFLLLSVAALGWGSYLATRKRDARFLILLVPFVLYTAYVLLSPLNIGVRYYLPAYPFLFILGGVLIDQAIRVGGRFKLAGVATALVIIGWMGVEAARAYPHYTSYMNQLAWSRPHWWYLSDSNVEWGDDGKAVAEYLRARGETEVRSAFLGGWRTLHPYGVRYVDVLDPSRKDLPQTRYFAIGASFLNGSTVPMRFIGGEWRSDEERVNLFDAYRRREPEAVFGGSIYLYREFE